MENRSLGETGLTVSRIGLGLAALGRPGYINLGHNEDLRERTSVTHLEAYVHNMLDVAWDHGIRYFDAARSYGRAEEFLGQWLALRGINTEDCVIGSKWGYIYTADWKIDTDVHEVKEHSLENLQRQTQESLDHLSPWLDLYQIHSATESSGVLDDQLILDELARLKAKGRIRAVGVTLSGPDSARTLDHVLSIERDGIQLFDSIQVTWNILEQSLTHLLADAHRAGLGVIVKEAFANGRLTERNTMPEFAETRTRIEAVADHAGCTMDQLAIAFILDQPWVDCVLTGAASPEQLHSNVAGASVTIDIGMRDELHQLQEIPEDYWEIRAALPWQ